MKVFNLFKNASQNNKIIMKNTAGAFTIKGLALVISLFTTPAFIKYFNSNIILGVWYTLLSVLLWVLNFDLGIGNGIRNNLVRALTNNDRVTAKKIISSGTFTIFIITLIMLVVGLPLLSLINLNWLFNISSDIISYKALLNSVICIFIAIIIRFFFTIISSIFYALQKSVINDFLALCVSVLQLLYVLIFHYESPEEALVALSFAYLIISNLPILIAGIIVFCTTLKDCKPNIKFVNKEQSKKVMSVGGIFFLCQITYMLIANTNEFLITKLFSPKFTTEYSFYYKLTNLSSVIITLALSPIWSLVTKAMAENDFKWIEKLYKKIKIFGCIAIFLQFALIPFLQFIFNIWLGKGVVTVNYLTAIAFACFGSSFVYSGMLSTIVCGMAKMKLQTICYSLGVIIKFLIVILFAKLFNIGWDIVVWSNAIILIPYCVLQQIELNIYFKKNKITNITTKTVKELNEGEL